jgi:mRNA interferase MazF
MVCPITNTFRNSPFHVELPQASTLTGYIMVEQVKSIDFRSRKLKFVEKGPQAILDDVLGILEACIFQNI